MEETSQEKFLQPVISTLGLLVSVVTSLLPLLTRGPVSKLFLDENLALPSSFLAFLLGAAAVWIIITHFRFIYLPLGKFKDRGKGFLEYYYVISNKSASIILLFCNLVIAFGFLYLTLFGSSDNQFQALIQSIFYVFFFISLTILFSILYSQTQDKYRFDEERRNVSRILFETLSKNGLISAGIQLHEMRNLTREEREKYGEVILPGSRFVKIRTVKQKDQVLEIIVSSDSREVIKVLRRQDVKD